MNFKNIINAFNANDAPAIEIKNQVFSSKLSLMNSFAFITLLSILFIMKRIEIIKKIMIIEAHAMTISMIVSIKPNDCNLVPHLLGLTVIDI